MNDLKELIQRISFDLPYRVYVKDVNRRFIYCNAMTIRALHCRSFADVKDKCDEDYFAGIHLHEAIEDEQRLLRPNGPLSLSPKEETETWRDGRLTRVVTEKRAWIGAHGERKGIIGFSHEIDALGSAKIFPKALDSLGIAAGAYLGTYLTRLNKRRPSHRRLKSLLFFNSGDTWMDQVFKDTFPGRTLHERMRMIETADREDVFKFLDAAKTRGVGYYDSVTFRSRGKREIRATGVVYKDRVTRQLYLCVEHREVSRGLGRDALSYEILRRFPGFIFVKDRERRFVYMNQPLLLRFGMKDISELSRRARKGGRPDDKDLGLPARDRKVYERGDRAILDESRKMHISDDEVISVTNMDGEERTKGERIFISTIKVPVPGHWFDPDEPKNSVYVLGIAWETNSILRKLHDKQMLWDTLLSNARDIIYSKTLLGKYQDVSTSFVDLRGWSKSDIVGHSASEVWSEYGTEILKMIEEDKQVAQEKKPMRDIIRTILRANGERVQVRSQKFPILDENGQIRLILGISRF